MRSCVFETSMMAECDVKSTCQKDREQLMSRCCFNFNTLHMPTFLVTKLTRSPGLFVLALLVVVV